MSKIHINGKEVTESVVDIKINYDADSIKSALASLTATLSEPSVRALISSVFIGGIPYDLTPDTIEFCGDVMISRRGNKFSCTQPKGHGPEIKHGNAYAQWGTFEVGEKGCYEDPKFHPSNPYREYM